MTAQQRPDLKGLQDIHLIEQVLYRYAIAVDTRDTDLLGSCFSKDARLVLAGTGTFTIKEYQALCSEVLPGLDATQHAVSAPTIRLMGDKAESRCYFIAQHAKNSLYPNPLLIIGGWYDDELAIIDGEWRITTRIGTGVWFDGNPEVLGLPMKPGGWDWSERRSTPRWL